MKIYKVDRGQSMDGQMGFSFHSSLKSATGAASAANKENSGTHGTAAEIETIEVTPTKRGIIAALNRHAGHNDNG